MLLCFCEKCCLALNMLYSVQVDSVHFHSLNASYIKIYRYIVHMN